MAIGLRVRGPFTGPTGYDHHVREFVRALTQLGAGVQLVDMPEWGPVRLPYHLRDPWFETLDAPVESRTTVHFSFPTQVEPESGRLDVNFTMFEATRIPSPWAEAHTAADLIVLPTHHSLRAWADSGVPESKLRLCPLGVRTDLYRPDVRPLPLADEAGRPLSTYGARFLNISQLDGRKNQSGLIRAWLRATSRGDDAVLIIKAGLYTPGSLATFQAEVQLAEEAAHKRLDKAAPVHIVYDLLPDADMPRLFAAATHYVSLSFGEGWDLAMMEAASCDLGLIAPKHSAYLEYLDDDIAAMIPSREAPALNAVGEWVSEWFTGANWWVPDEDEAVRLLREAVRSGARSPGSPRKRMIERYTWQKAASRLLEVVGAAEATAGRQSAG
jgi:glycosyltransferase involved in cell wall biosynthesis